MKEKKISFLVDEEELKLMEKVTLLEPFLQDVVEKAKRVKDQYRIRFSIEDIKEAMEALSYAARCMATYPENEKMYKLHEKIESYLILQQVFEK